MLGIEDRKRLLAIVNAVPDAQVLGDLESLVAWLKRRPEARGDRIGVAGFCRGGLYTLLFAAQSPEVRAAVVWYGPIRPPLTPGVRSRGPLDVAALIRAPLLGLYGRADLGIPVADVHALEAAL